MSLGRDQREKLREGNCPVAEGKVIAFGDRVVVEMDADQAWGEAA